MAKILIFALAFIAAVAADPLVYPAYAGFPFSGYNYPAQAYSYAASYPAPVAVAAAPSPYASPLTYAPYYNEVPAVYAGDATARFIAASPFDYLYKR